MNDFREYIGVDYVPYLMHYGRSVVDGAPGRGSGRYPRGSGENPKAKSVNVDPSKQAKAYTKELNKLDHQRLIAQRKVDQAKIKMDALLKKMDSDGYKVKKKAVLRTIAYGDKYLESNAPIANMFYRLLYGKNSKIEEAGIKYKVKEPSRK